MWIDRTNKTPLQSPLSYPTLPLLPAAPFVSYYLFASSSAERNRILLIQQSERDGGSGSRYGIVVVLLQRSCELPPSHVNKLTQLMEHRPVITDQRPAATARPCHRRAIPGVEDGPGDGVRHTGLDRNQARDVEEPGGVIRGGEEKEE
jgi:hypothetical protein